MPYLAHVDALACTAHGDCEDLAPELFSLDGDVASVIGTGYDELAIEAARVCPSVAIRVTDAATGEQVFP
jgi:ferredoxin